MEIAYSGFDDSIYVTNGLLVVELIDGRIQLGDDTFDEAPEPADVNIAGDPGERPTYADIERWALQDEVARSAGTLITHRIDDDGVVSSDMSLAAHGVTAWEYVPETDHTVASPFWLFMTSTGIVYQDGQYVTAPLFVIGYAEAEPFPYWGTGYPITEAYWSTIVVGGIERDILWQCFERRCLTYNPANEPTWQVEAGNVGQHYYTWRYGGPPPQQ